MKSADTAALDRPAELHRHLDGSIRSATLHELADTYGLQVPPDLVFTDHMGLSDALARFAFTLSCLQNSNDVLRVAREMIEDAQNEGLSALEVRFAPQLHQGAPLEEIVDAAIDGLADRAGLILCGLYGEHPTVLEKLVQIGSVRDGVVGIDLAGGPAPEHRWTLMDYASAFGAAAEAGLGRTVHVSEGRPPDEIITAITHLKAQRLGHATTLMENPRATDLVLAHDVIIESCPTSNIHTGAVESIDVHPIRDWIAADIPVAICADNTLLSNTTISVEQSTLLEAQCLSEDGLRTCAHHSRRALFSGRFLS